MKEFRVMISSITCASYQTFINAIPNTIETRELCLLVSLSILNSVSHEFYLVLKQVQKVKLWQVAMEISKLPCKEILEKLKEETEANTSQEQDGNESTTNQFRTIRVFIFST